VPLKKTIEDVLEVFGSEFKENEISMSVTGPDDFVFLCWRQDLYAIFTNLADNSIYWMREKSSSQRQISINFAAEAGSLEYIDYRDTGPGIERGFIETEVIFEPHFSTRPGGTGLGLAIAGEAALRNDLELKAFESANGAYFRLQPKAGDGR
jgi:signal transduction histidine kinase